MLFNSIIYLIYSKQVLKISDGIDNLGSIDIPIAIALFASWATVFIALSKGVQSLGKVIKYVLLL